MSDALLVAIVTTLLSGGVVTALAGWLRDRKRAPIDALSAVTAMSESVGRQAVALVEQLQEQQVADRSVSRLEIERLRADLTRQQHAVGVIRRELSNLRSAWSAWYRAVIVDQWDTVRRDPSPPDPPTLSATRSTDPLTKETSWLD